MICTYKRKSRVCAHKGKSPVYNCIHPISLCPLLLLILMGYHHPPDYMSANWLVMKNSQHQLLSIIYLFILFENERKKLPLNNNYLREKYYYNIYLTLNFHSLSLLCVSQMRVKTQNRKLSRCSYKRARHITRGGCFIAAVRSLYKTRRQKKASRGGLAIVRSATSVVVILFLFSFFCSFLQLTFLF